MVQEDFFDEIMNTIIANNELFDEKEGQLLYGSFELYVEIEDYSNYYYLNQKDKSICFFSILLESAAITRYVSLISELEKIIRRLNM